MSLKKDIVIAGFGFVGKAVNKVLKGSHNCIIVDPMYTDIDIKHQQYAHGVIICVGTPSTYDGACDDSQIRQVLENVAPNIPVLIKSTVTPDKLEKIIIDFPSNPICYSPEFLRAKTAEFDFINQKYVVLGGDDPDCFWENLLTPLLPSCKIFFKCTLVEASLIKYATNSFLATKVAFFNHIYDLCQTSGAEFNTVRQIISHDHRIGSSHTLVPGIDEDRGFGGHCFPKDTKALVHYANSVGVSLDILEAAIEYNKTVRKTLDL